MMEDGRGGRGMQGCVAAGTGQVVYFYMLYIWWIISLFIGWTVVFLCFYMLYTSTPALLVQGGIYIHIYIYIY